MPRSIVPVLVQMVDVAGRFHLEQTLSFDGAHRHEKSQEKPRSPSPGGGCTSGSLGNLPNCPNPSQILYPKRRVGAAFNPFQAKGLPSRVPGTETPKLAVGLLCWIQRFWGVGA